MTSIDRGSDRSMPGRSPLPIVAMAKLRRTAELDPGPEASLAGGTLAMLLAATTVMSNDTKPAFLWGLPLALY